MWKLLYAHAVHIESFVFENDDNLIWIKLSIILWLMVELHSVSLLISDYTWSKRFWVGGEGSEVQFVIEVCFPSNLDMNYYSAIVWHHADIVQRVPSIATSSDSYSLPFNEMMSVGVRLFSVYNSSLSNVGFQH